MHDNSPAGRRAGTDGWRAPGSCWRCTHRWSSGRPSHSLAPRWQLWEDSAAPGPAPEHSEEGESDVIFKRHTLTHTHTRRAAIIPLSCTAESISPPKEAGLNFTAHAHSENTLDRRSDQSCSSTLRLFFLLLWLHRWLKCKNSSHFQIYFSVGFVRT